MKRSFLNFVLPCAMMLGVMTGCDNKPDDPLVESLIINPKTLSFDKEAAEKTFGIESNTSWTILCSDTWLTCTPVSGTGNNSAVKVSVSANSSTEIRTGTVTVKTEGGIEELVQVTQGGISPFIIIDPDAASVGCTGGDVTVAVTASGTWTVQIPNDAGWVTSSKTETQAILTVAANGTYQGRLAVITFKLDGTNVQETFNLSQDGVVPSIEIDPDAATVEHTGGNITVNVTASGLWTVQIPNDADWVTSSKTETQAVLTVAANGTVQERSAFITFKLDGSDVQETFNLTQKRELVWVEITKDVLKNTDAPFDHGAHIGLSRWHAVVDWTTNAAAAANGNVDTHEELLGGVLGFIVWDAGFLPAQSITNGKLYQTVNLVAGKYRFNAYLFGNTQVSGNPKAYVVAALGNDLPNTDDAEQMALGYVLVPGPLGAGQNMQLSVEFVLSESSAVSLGFVATSGNRCQVYFRKVELWRLLE